ncbi:uncharacterized protein LOC106178588 [Lingula anatina]|uniref:Uncharacterized protein LOC106178588 n=1 Tax=Lingula anatina TaxID=7574 RepID=A0A1S3K435_LINAN|nr:uncharacterized protein LOC106178588 [Lingula anatina]|eukprot:XP_013417287.1 uncharacterized protein LOC106178588 [Lingula anatina]
MYITVRFGDQEQALFNPHCRIISLVNEIKAKCRCEDVDIDLCDESGNVKHLGHQAQFKFASDLLVDRETYILIKVERKDGDPQYLPLLQADDETLSEAFFARLSSKDDELKVYGRRGRAASRDVRRGSKEYLKLKQLGDKSSVKSKSPTQTRTKSRQSSK